MKNGSYVIPSMKAKEVQAQNEALRLENRELKERFKNTEVKIDRLEKANDGYEKKIADYYKPTERFAKDQRDKQTVYLDYLANNPQAKEAVKPFESEYAAIRQYGKELLEHKWGYVECGNNLKETEQKIADNAAQKGDERAAITDISKCNKELYDMRGTVDNRRECLDALEGKLFKGKEKKALQSEIEGIQSKIEKVENHLQESYGIKETYPDDLAKETNRHTERLDDLEQKGKDLAVQRSTLHAERYNHLQEYKYMAVKSKAFRQEWQNVIGRWDNDFKPEFQDSIRLNIDQLTRDERTSFKDRLVSDKFDKSPAMSFIKNQEEAKTQSKSISQNHDIGHSL
jgi:DNA-binding transcriptional regulator GbsR (MarR family)